MDYVIEKQGINLQFLILKIIFGKKYVKMFLLNSAEFIDLKKYFE